VVFSPDQHHPSQREMSPVPSESSVGLIIIEGGASTFFYQYFNYIGLSFNYLHTLSLDCLFQDDGLILSDQTDRLQLYIIYPFHTFKFLPAL
jgi:hypothetical protein